MANAFSRGGRFVFSILFLSWGILWTEGQPSLAQPSKKATDSVLIVVEGKVELQKVGSTNWMTAQVNQVLHPGDRLRTGPRSRAEIRLSNLTVLPVNASTTLVFEAPEESGGRPILNLQNGSIYMQSRERPGQVRFRTRLVSGAIRGTEFHLSIDEEGETKVHLFDGQIDLNNEHGQLSLNKNEEATVAPGKAPVRTALLNARAVIQWVLYYPAVLDPNELHFTSAEKEAVAGSIDLYRKGDLPGALRAYPENRTPTTEAESLFLGTLLLSSGQVQDTEKYLSGKNTTAANALRLLIETVRGSSAEKAATTTVAEGGSSASLLLAQSYAAQATLDLEKALQLARRAAEASPQFGYAWERIAELEFSFGRVPAANEALAKALELSPSNAQAHALKGFLLAAENNLSGALAQFERAIELDGALASGWLGRGLIKIRRNDVEAGREDLQVASTLEPRRSAFRSYLAKAFSLLHDSKLARKEIELAKELDANDPSAWLYSALLNQIDSRINEAALDLEKSQELNDNRQVYRSGLLLEQDRAVRSANLAGIYRDAGMREQSVREAVRAVNSDYGNYSGHLFLANSYDALRDPRYYNLRYETPWLSEFLLANLLAPVGAGTLSQSISQQEYSKLFERNKLGISSSTDYFSNGDWIQKGSQFGTFGNSGYSLDTVYRSDTGQRPNHDFEELTVSASFKQQLTLQDSIYVQGIYYDAEGGDLAQFYNPADANRQRFEENQEPIVLAGYHREWKPGSHTLLLFSRLDDSFEVRDPGHQLLFLGKNAGGDTVLESRPPPTAPLKYSSDFEAYSFEGQHILQFERNDLIAGGRFQTGTFDTRSDLGVSTPTRLTNNAGAGTVAAFTSPAVRQSFSPELQRFSLYAYDSLKIMERLRVIGGLTYDYLEYPVNYRLAPLDPGERHEDQFSPKAGLIWTPCQDTVIRGSYTRSLGGVSYDQSFRLEPVQVAGFVQSYRNVIPESVAGSLAGATFETGGLEIEQKIGRRLFLGAAAEIINSEADRDLGVIDVAGFSIGPSSTQQELTFQEKNLYVTGNYLLGEYWSLGARYRLSDADLNSRFPAIPSTVSALSNTDREATLQEATLFALFNHSSGFFGRFDSIWHQQSNRGYTPNLPGDDYWTFNVYAGWRLLDRRVTAQIGLINLTDQDFQLNPLNWHTEYYRERTFTASFRFYF